MLAPTSAAAASARADVGLIKRREGRKKKNNNKNLVSLHGSLREHIRIPNHTFIFFMLKANKSH